MGEVLFAAPKSTPKVPTRDVARFNKHLYAMDGGHANFAGAKICHGVLPLPPWLYSAKPEGAKHTTLCTQLTAILGSASSGLLHPRPV